MRQRRLIVLAALCLASAGCGGNKEAYKYRVAVIPKGLTHEFWQSIHRGAQRAAADLKEQGVSVEVLWDGPRTESDAQAQIAIVDRHVANRVSGLALAPQHSETMVAPVQKAVDKGIPVVIIDSGLANPDLIVKYVATDNYRGGRLAAERLLKVLREEGKPAPKLVLFRYAVGSESTEQREKGFEDVVNAAIAGQKKKGEPTITWLSNDQYAGATTDSALKAATPLINSLRDKGIDGIFAPNESSAMGMLKALESLRLNGKIRLVGFDSSPPLLEAVGRGDIDGLILQDPYRMGYLGVWTLVQHLEGMNVAPDSNKVQSTGEHVITRANLKDRSTQELFTPELQGQRKIDTPAYPKR
jgi:ribose transport system substrate-binding protein